MSRSRAMRRIRQAINRQIDEIQPDRPLLSRRELLKVTCLALVDYPSYHGLLESKT
jgi:hypothetical protein